MKSALINQASYFVAAERIGNVDELSQKQLVPTDELTKPTELVIYSTIPLLV